MHPHVSRKLLSNNTMKILIRNVKNTIVSILINNEYLIVLSANYLTQKYQMDLVHKRKEKSIAYQKRKKKYIYIQAEKKKKSLSKNFNLVQIENMKENDFKFKIINSIILFHYKKLENLKESLEIRKFLSTKKG